MDPCESGSVHQQPGKTARSWTANPGVLSQVYSWVSRGLEVKAEELQKQRALRPRRTRWSNRTRGQEIQLSTGAAGQTIGPMARLTQQWTECCEQVVPDVILHKQKSVIKPSTTVRRASGSLGPLVGWGEIRVRKEPRVRGFPPTASLGF